MSKRIDRIHNFRYPVSQPTVFDEQELTVLELVSKVAYKINETVGEVNSWIDYLDVFVKAFDKKLQTTVTETLTEWQDSGLLDVIIDEALQTQMDVLESETHTKLEMFETQLAEKATKEEVKARSEARGVDVVMDLGLDNSLPINNLDLSLEENKVYFFPKGKYSFSEYINVPPNVTLIGSQAEITNLGFQLTGSDNVTITGFIFNSTFVGSEPSGGVISTNSNNLNINNNTFNLSRIYCGINQGFNISANLQITNNTFTGDFSQYTTSRVVTVESHDGIIITDNSFECYNVRAFLKLQAGTHSSFNDLQYVDENYVKNIVCSNNVIKGTCTDSVISLYTGAGENIIEGNIFNIGTETTPTHVVIDGKSSGESNGTVYTNKIKNLNINNNVITGYIEANVIRVYGGYATEWEGEKQFVNIHSNLINNHSESTMPATIIVNGMHNANISLNTLSSKSTSKHLAAIYSGNCEIVSICNNNIIVGCLTVTETGSTTTGYTYSGKVKKITISNNTIDKWRGTGGIVISALNNANSLISITGNNMETDFYGDPGTFSIDIRNGVYGTLLITSNIGVNPINPSAEQPNISGSTLSKKIDVNNSWNNA